MLKRFAATLPGTVFTHADPPLLDKLAAVVEMKSVELRFVSGPILTALCYHPEVARLLVESRTVIDFRDAARRIVGVPLLLRLMSLTPLPDYDIENLLVRLRRRMLETLDGDPVCLPVAAALAQQAFINEYVYPESIEEEEALSDLVRQIGQALHEKRDLPPIWILALAAYRPLHGFAWSPMLEARDWPSDVKAVLTQQIAEPVAEREIARTLPRMTPMKEAASARVREQYEINPYPRWIRFAACDTPVPLGDFVRGWSSSPVLHGTSLPATPEILIAGCGTGRQSLVAASCYANARVLAVDLSTASLAYAVRKTRQFGVGSIEYGQADLLEIGDLGRTFDYIESIGVLHHLPDPAAGFRALAKVLRPGGLMRIGLYSRAEREHWFVKVRELVGGVLPESADDIRYFRQVVIERAFGPSPDRDLRVAAHMIDFFSLSECRDLLFHVQEHRFDAARINACLQAGGLNFVGFEEGINQMALDDLRRTNPDPAARFSLPAWQQHEAMGGRPPVYRFLCQKPGR